MSSNRKNLKRELERMIETIDSIDPETHYPDGIRQKLDRLYFLHSSAEDIVSALGREMRSPSPAAASPSPAASPCAANDCPRAGCGDCQCNNSAAS
jgi:hypothetical protein